MRVAVAILGAVAAIACAVSHEGTVEDRPVGTVPAEVHAVQGERLAGLMLDLDRLAGTRLPQALDLEGLWGERASEVAEVARAIAASASAIPGAAPPLAESEPEEFAALAEGLRVRALAVAAAAQGRDEELLRAAAAELEAACAGCHQRFRLPR